MTTAYTLVPLSEEGAPGSIGTEYEGGDLPAAAAEVAATFARFSDATLRVFPGLRAEQIWRRRWSFGIEVDRASPWDNVQCNVHASGNRGTEAVSTRVIVRHPALNMDYRFFFLFQDEERTRQVMTIIRDTFSLD